MKQRKKHRGIQGHALLYGRSSRAIRIIPGEIDEGVDKRHRPPKKTSKPVMVKQVQKKYKMDESVKRRLDNLQDPLDMMSRSARAQKYEAANSTEKYEYGLSDW